MFPIATDMIRVIDLTEDEDIALGRKATDFLTAFRWCASVRESFLAFGSGHILGVFLFRIEPRLLGVDDTLWVVVGDLPSAFLVCDDAPDWRCALKCYVREMQRWVVAVLSGCSLEGIIPVRVSPTPEHAGMLASRLKFIQDNCIDDKPLKDDHNT